MKTTTTTQTTHYEVQKQPRESLLDAVAREVLPHVSGGRAAAMGAR